MSRKLGISDQQIFELPRFRSTTLLTDKEKTALEYSEEMTRTPVEISDGLFARLRQHFNENQMVELTASIAYENFRARFDHALGIGSDGLYVCAWPPPSGKTEAVP